MVKALIKEMRTKDRISKTISERVYGYYPELSGSDIKVTCRPFVKKLHKSNIYQIDLENDGRFFKSLIVKKRIFNPIYNNNIIKSTKEEYENLISLSGMANGALATPIVLDAIAEEGLLISEKVEGMTLSECLRQSAYLPMTEYKKVFLEDLFIKIGLWLKRFHTENQNGHKEKIDTSGYIKRAEEIADRFPGLGLPKNLGRAVIAKMKNLEKDILRQEFTVTSKHGDFQPMNIIYHKDKVSVLDISSTQKDIALKDVASFIIGVNTFDIKLLYSFLAHDYLNGMIEDFLKAYFGKEPIPYKAIKFLDCAGMIKSFAFMHRRNPFFIRRKWIARFYNKKLKELLTRD